MNECYPGVLVQFCSRVHQSRRKKFAASPRACPNRHLVQFCAYRNRGNPIRHSVKVCKPKPEPACKPNLGLTW